MKNQFKENWIKKNLNTAAAGPVPNSLLARQDLDDDTTEKAMCPGCGLEPGIYLVRFDGVNHIVVKSEDACSSCGNDMIKSTETNKIDAQIKDQQQLMANAKRIGDFEMVSEHQERIEQLQAKKNEMTKGAIEQTGKKLDIIEQKAQDADTTETKDELVDKLKSTQLKRQKAIINARKSMNTSFKKHWADINKTSDKCKACKGSGENKSAECRECDGTGSQAYANENPANKSSDGLAKDWSSDARRSKDWKFTQWYKGEEIFQHVKSGKYYADVGGANEVSSLSACKEYISDFKDEMSGR